MTDEFARDDIEPAESATAQVLARIAALRLSARTATNLIRDHCPKQDRSQGAVADMFDALVATLSDTRLEGDLQQLLWSLTNVFHLQPRPRSSARSIATKATSAAASAIRTAPKSARSNSNAFSPRAYRCRTAQRPRIHARRRRRRSSNAISAHAGGRATARASAISALTAAVIDSRDFIAAKRRAEIEPLTPAGTKIAFAGGVDCNDHQPHLGGARSRARQARRHGAAPWRNAARRREDRRLPGPTLARSRRSSSSPTGSATARPRRSSATTRSSKRSPSASSSSPAPASPTTSPTKPSASASRSSITEGDPGAEAPLRNVRKIPQSRSSI